jgi:formylglycine-generating enzyme required for sulfatase activity
MGTGNAAHQIYLDNYYMDIYEVTNAAYKLCVDGGKCDPPSDTNKYNNSTYAQHPVVYVDWNMARTYCEWRGARLPTEGEWEKAARGTDGRTYPWGEGIDCNKSNYSYNCAKNTTPVGSYESGKSPYGLYDMAGNVLEWTSSFYKSYPYVYNDGREDLNASGSRALRGGSWDGIDYVACASNRDRLDPSSVNVNIGFRCARSP